MTHREQIEQRARFCELIAAELAFPRVERDLAAEEATRLRWALSEIDRLTAEVSAAETRGEQRGREKVCRVATAMWALVDFVKASGHPFDSWPVALKDAFAEAIVDRSPATPEEIKRTEQLAAEMGWVRAEKGE